MRVAPQRWRQVKSDLGIDPTLDILLVSSRGHRRTRTQASGTSRQKSSAIPQDFPQRLALNSHALLETLERCTGISYPSDRNVWLRPFKPLVIFRDEIRQAQQEAEDQAADPLSKEDNVSDDRDANKDRTDSDIPKVTEDVSRDNGGNAASTLARSKEELRCLLDFMDTDMPDIFEVQHQVNSGAIKEIAFEYLWLLYKPGDLVFSAASTNDDTLCQAYRVLHVTGARHIIHTKRDRYSETVRGPDWEYDAEGEDYGTDKARNSTQMSPLILDLFSIDCNGYRYGPKAKRVVISEYKDERPITSLGVYPASFHPEYEKLYDALIARGKRFVQLANGSHRQYAGMTLRESRQYPVDMSYRNYILHDEEVRNPSFTTLRQSDLANQSEKL